jgi:NAD(P)-dependent dehydrogenase (short-subunit alcohol dehydrogenase family)
MTELFNLDERVAVVTGGAGLIGRELCAGLAEQGSTVVIADADAAAGERLADEIGEQAQFVATDVTSAASVEKLVESTVEEFGSLDVLVNTAYPRNENYGQPYEEMTVEDWRTNVDLHLTSYFYTSYCASLVMKDQESGGSIINFGSTYGVQAPDFTTYGGLDMTSPVEYAAIKGGILNLVRYMASYLGEDGVRVNAVSPGGVFDDHDREFVANYRQRTPLGRMASPADLVGPVVFLASDAAGYVTGHNLVDGGGWTVY